MFFVLFEFSNGIVISILLFGLILPGFILFYFISKTYQICASIVFQIIFVEFFVSTMYFAIFSGKCDRVAISSIALFLCIRFDEIELWWRLFDEYRKFERGKVKGRKNATQNRLQTWTKHATTVAALQQFRVLRAKYDYIVEKWDCNKKSNQNNKIPFTKDMKMVAEHCDNGTKAELNWTEPNRIASHRTKLKSST